MTAIDVPQAGSLGFRDATRIQQSITASVERKILLWLARRTPDRVSPDHLTALGFVAQLLAAASYAWARWNKWGLVLAAIFIGVNWLGDSLDGTLARYRGRLRPRYGFYLDHMIDSFGAVALMSGLAASGYIHWQVSAGMLVAFLMLSIETYLTAYTLSDFRLSHGFFGPTEIRILLIAGSLAVLFSPRVRIFGLELLLFDAGGLVATIVMMGMVIAAATRHTVQLYQKEGLP
ncbi:MAG TPA: CDP-alcohol phosphatidyltransferase family protein [Candidatus Acidoferrales bacterium]|nr:CDP-alcohol phosphatidyltransferase family protein [Candidatus Acidoferrales bacterium]